MNVCESLTRSAKLFPDHDAVVFEGQRFTYADLNATSAALAQHLVDQNVQPGQRVALMLPNVPAFVVWYYAALRIGAIAVSISTRLAASEVQFVLEDCGASAFIGLPQAIELTGDCLPDAVMLSITTNEAGNSIDGNLIDGNSISRTDATNDWHDADPHDPATVLYTSGTTGFAKGATLSHTNIRSNVHAFNHLCNQRPTDRILLAVPLFHCFGQNALLNAALNVGATLVFQRKFDLNESRQLIVDHQVTQLYGVPMMFQLLRESCSTADLESVNYCFSAAAPLPIQVAQAWQQKFGMPIHEGYGLTETSPFASYNHRDRFVPGSIGTPIDAVEMKVVDTESGQTVAAGELGEIAVRGPNVMLGYWNRPEDTAAAIRDGWFYSGDIGRQDEQGFFYIVDRVKDMIAVGGMKVYPAEVERVLMDHPAVDQVAVVGFPDEVFGEKVIGFVVPSDTHANAKNESPDDLVRSTIEHARQHLANFKTPQQIVIAEQLPRNPSGKVLKTKLREHTLPDRLVVASDDADTNSTSTALAAVREPTLRKLLASTHQASRKGVAIEFLQGLIGSLTDSTETVEHDARFLDVGMDSLTVVELSTQLQAELGDTETIPPTLVFDYPRVEDLAQFLVETCEPKTATNYSQQTTSNDNASPQSNADLKDQVAGMTEDEAMAELMRELES